jgi:DNA-binding transcriptional LysR family regulator
MIPRVAVERELELGYLRAVEVRGGRIPNRQISLLFRRNRRLPRAVRAFFDLIGELYGVRVEAPEDASAPK